MKKQEIVSVLSELHKITGFRVSLHGADYSEIAAYPETKSEFCKRLQMKPEEYKNVWRVIKTHAARLSLGETLTYTNVDLALPKQ